MNKTFWSVAAAGCLAATGATAADLGLAVQAWTFRSGTFLEAVEKTAKAGVTLIEAYPGQKIGGDIEGAMAPEMDAATQAKVLAKLKTAGVTLVNFGVYNTQGEDSWRKAFAFAKAMGIRTLVAEPGADQMEMLDRLTGEYGVRIAIHNHPKPSRYWNPDTVLEAVKGRSPRIGACADTGHWVRSGLDPLECLRKLEGRIVGLHLKDLDRRDPGAHDVVWGTGASEAAKQVAELKRQGFKGVVSIEYEHETPELLDHVTKCAAFFAKCTAAGAKGVAGALGAAGAAGAALPTRMSAEPRDVFANAPKGEEGKWAEDMFAPAPGAPKRPDTAGYSDATDNRSRGSVTASGPGFPNEGPMNAFDNTPSKYCVEQKALWLQYKFPEGEKPRVAAYVITSANDAPGRDPKAWRLLGSDDGQKWTTLDERADQTFEAR